MIKVFFNSWGFQYLSSFFCFLQKNNQVSNYMFQAKETLKYSDFNCVYRVHCLLNVDGVQKNHIHRIMQKEQISIFNLCFSTMGDMFLT